MQLFYTLLINTSNFTITGNLTEAGKASLTDSNIKYIGGNGQLNINYANNSIYLNGEYNLKNLINFLNIAKPAPENLKEIIEEIKDRREISLTDKLKSGLSNFIIFFTDDGDEISIPKKIGEFTILISSNKKLANEIGSKFPGYFSYNAKENEFYALENANINDIMKFTLAPKFGKITPNNIKNYENEGFTTFYIFYEKNNLTDFLPVAEKFKNDIKIGLVKFDSENKKHQELMGKKSLPFAIHFNGSTAYGPENLSKITLENYITEFLQGKIKMHNLEEPPIDNSKNDVKIAVRSTIKQYLENHSKDRLIMFYANWCGACKNVMSTIDELGKLSKKYNDYLEIVKIDLAKNNIGRQKFEINFYPTIMLFKAKTNEFVQFTGNRSLNDFIKFIREIGNHNVDLSSNEDL